MKLLFILISFLLFINNSLSEVDTSYSSFSSSSSSSSSSSIFPYDFIVVGSGVSGSILAYRLSQKGYSVLIIEGGGKSIAALGGNDYIGTKGTLNSDNVYTPQRPLTKYDVPFFFQSADINGNRWDIPGTNVAKMIGGSGLHNAMVYQRGIDSDYDWGLTGWNWSTLSSYFKKVETILDTDLTSSPDHGHDGFIKVKSIPFDKEGSDFVKSCNSSGISFNGDFQINPRQGCGYFQLNIDGNGERSSTAHEYLTRALSNSRVRLLHSATVTRIKWIYNVFTGKNEATGVEYVTDDAPNLIKTVYCTKEVILAAGTLNTPKILLNSGVGDANTLTQTKYSNFISPIKHLPGVGKNLQNHFIVFNVWTYSDSSWRPDFYTNFNINLQYQTTGTGILSTPGFSVGAWLKTNQSSSNPADSIMTIFPGALGSTLPGMMTFAVSLCEPTPNPTNKVELVSDTTGLSAIQFYKKGLQVTFAPSDIQADVDKLVSSIKESRRIMSFPPMSGLAIPVLPDSTISTDAQLESFVRNNIVPHDHWVGTCKMGDPTTDPNAVVDVNLKVIGVNKVRVVDASIYPKIPHGLLQATVMAVAEKAADTILSDYP